MSLIEAIKRLFVKPQPSKKTTYKYIFPYSADKEIKRRQIWSNLQQGLLFEDTGVFVPWDATYADIDKLSVDKRDSGDRTNYFLGEHDILDGYHSFVGVMRWSWINKQKPFLETDEFLGVDDKGNEKFNMLKDKLTDLLGEPEESGIEKFGGNDLGSYEWKNGDVRVSLVGIEQFALKYRMYIGKRSDY